jgi:hypothetical protein
MAGVAQSLAVAFAVILGAATAWGQDSQDALKKEVESLKEKVKALEEKAAAPAPAPVPAPEKSLMTLEDDDTILDVLMRDAKVGGFVDVGYVFNLDRPKNGINGALTVGDGSLRGFDRKARSFYANNAQLNLSRAATKELIVGYNVELSFGSDANVFGATPSALTDYFDLQEANVELLAPLGEGLSIRVGKFATLSGFEVIEAKDNWNYSRGLPFIWAIPFTHTGARATYTFTEQVTAVLGVVNGWDTFEDNNDGKTLEAQVSVTPIKWLKILATLYNGAEKSPTASGRDPGDKRMLVDLVALATDIPGVPGLSLGLNFDIAEDEDSVATATGVDDAEWTALGIHARYQINERWAGAFRYSMIDDKDGFRLGAPPVGTATDNTVSEVTLTAEWSPAKDLKIRLEFRNDMSDEDIFQDHDGTISEDSQSTLSAEFIITF